MMTQTTAATGVVTKAIRLACRAPSLHNSQPWRWIVAGGTTVDLFADHRQGIRSGGRSGREALISCGAALDHFRVAMAAGGWNINAELFPDPSHLDHLATIDFTPSHYITT